MSSPSTRRTIFARLVTSSFRSTCCGCMIWRRPNASSWRVRPAARSAASTMCRVADFPRHRIVLALQQREREPLDDGQNVVEVVSDAARELPDGLHLLRVAQLGLELALAGDVAADAEQRGDLAAGIAQGAGLGPEPATHAGDADDLELELAAFTRYHPAMQVLEVVRGTPARSIRATVAPAPVRARSPTAWRGRRDSFRSSSRRARRSSRIRDRCSQSCATAPRWFSIVRQGPPARRSASPTLGFVRSYPSTRQHDTRRSANYEHGRSFDLRPGW